VIADLESHPPSGRMVIHISADIDSWSNTPADIELRRGDVLTIPKTPGFVLVTGQVYNATALTYIPGKSASWYLSRAGGANASANRKEIFVIRANGTVVGRRSGRLLDGAVLSSKLDPGDVVVVPQKIMAEISLEKPSYGRSTGCFNGFNRRRCGGNALAFKMTAQTQFENIQNSYHGDSVADRFASMGVEL